MPAATTRRTKGEKALESVRLPRSDVAIRLKGRNTVPACFTTARVIASVKLALVLRTCMVGSA